MANNLLAMCSLYRLWVVDTDINYIMESVCFLQGIIRRGTDLDINVVIKLRSAGGKAL